MSNEISVNGDCHCGKISISAKIDKNKVRACHCTDCQKLGALRDSNCFNRINKY